MTTPHERDDVEPREEASDDLAIPSSKAPQIETRDEATPEVTDWSALSQLWSSQFRHLSSLSLAAVAGLFVLLQSGLLHPSRWVWTALAVFLGGACVALDGESTLIDDFENGPLAQQRLRRNRYTTLAALGLGVVLLVFAVSRQMT